MHLAAESHVDRSIHRPRRLHWTNIVGTYMMLEAARAYWNGLDEGTQGGLPLPATSPPTRYMATCHPDEASAGEPLPLFTETTPHAPSSPYSASQGFQ